MAGDLRVEDVLVVSAVVSAVIGWLVCGDLRRRRRFHGSAAGERMARTGCDGTRVSVSALPQQQAGPGAEFVDDPTVARPSSSGSSTIDVGPGGVPSRPGTAQCAVGDATTGDGADADLSVTTSPTANRHAEFSASSPARAGLMVLYGLDDPGLPPPRPIRGVRRSGSMHLGRSLDEILAAHFGPDDGRPVRR